ncbi:MAG TPA: GGDEF domain-containing protein [Gemmatimonadaceae bacterium]|nr:GGDEF domain-containing protein [Gemmatimonadaceae bacterium]
MTGFIGILVQMCGCVLLAALFALLRRHALRRRYFALWGSAWFACAAALLALVTLIGPYVANPPAAGTLIDVEHPAVRVLNFVYQFGKLLYLGLLAAGTTTYVRGLAGSARSARLAMLGAGVYALVSVTVATRVNDLVTLQAPAAVAVFLYCASVLLRLRASRATLGTRATGMVFLVMALLWASYIPAFGWSHIGATPRGLALIVNYNSYFDLLLQMLLGHGMVVVLMEDAKREVDDAHAELAVAHDQLRRATLYDALTGALNRLAFTEGVGLETARSSFGTVAVIDLDNLKLVNDAHGHAAGDELLRRLVSTLRDTLRPSDRLYRWGGDEFLLVLPGARPESVLPRIEAAIAEAPPLVLHGAPEPLRVQASVGAVEFADAEALEPAILRADAAMYARKRESRTTGRQGRVPVAG